MTSYEETAWGRARGLDAILQVMTQPGGIIATMVEQSGGTLDVDWVLLRFGQEWHRLDVLEGTAEIWTQLTRLEQAIFEKMMIGIALSRDGILYLAVDECHCRLE